MELKVFLFSAVILLYKARLGCSRSIQKRSVFQLCNLIQFHSDVMCVRVNDYGCFCGLGQNGNQPLDNIDRCCYEHDNCYGNLSRCYWYIPQILHYWYNCDHVTKTCTCTGNWLCQQDVCECDLQFARCLKDAFRTTEFSAAYRNYNISRCV